MTLAAEFPTYDRPNTTDQATADLALPLWKLIAITLVATFAFSLPNLIDPFIRYDDYPAFFAEAHWFWRKTLHEGRWLNYVWHLRGISTPSWFNFAIYQSLWAVLSAALAMAAVGRDGRPWFTIVLALFIVVCAPAILISTWFNTLVPGLAVVTLYAVLGVSVSQRSLRTLLPVFVVLSFWAYTTYPLILLTVCLLQTRNRSLLDLCGLMTLFVLSFAAAILLTYTLNWHVHGVFGVPLDEWRNATPASDVSGLITNLSFLSETFKTLMINGSYFFMPAAYFHVGMLLTGSLVMAYYVPREAVYLQAGLWAGVALIALQALKLGVLVPPRAFIFAWVIYAVIVLRAAALLSETQGLGGRIMRNLSLLVFLGYMLQTFSYYASYRPWQEETRILSQRLASIETATPVLVYGDVLTLDSAHAADVHSDIALAFRIRQLTGHEVLLCHSAPEDCAPIEEARRADGVSVALRVDVETSDDVVRLSAPHEFP